MQMLFSSGKELKRFLTERGDWKKWVDNEYKHGGVLSLMCESPTEKGVITVSHYTKADIEELMNGVD